MSTELAAELGLHIAIVDANDLRRAKALGASPASYAMRLRRRYSGIRPATVTNKRRWSSLLGAAPVLTPWWRGMIDLLVRAHRNVRAGGRFWRRH